MDISSYARQVKKLHAQVMDLTSEDLFFPQYKDLPCEFARDILKVEWTDTQKEIAWSLLEKPYRTLVPAAHTVGKSFLVAGIILWWHLTRKPAIVLVTATKKEQVSDIVFKECRRQGRGLVKFAGSRACRINRGLDNEDFVLGTTAADGIGFQGHHGPNMLFVFDEAVGVAKEFWEVTESMFKPPGHAWCCIHNPTDSSSYAYAAQQEIDGEGRPKWHTIQMSAINHPNIAAEVKGLPPPVPDAITLDRLDDLLRQWSDPVLPGTQLATDVEWPPGSGKYLRPGPMAQARLLGRWPSSGHSVWSDELWRSCERQIPLRPEWRLVIGCDCARFGEDFSTMHVRMGPCSLHHERHNGWDGDMVTGRLKQMCMEWARFLNSMRDRNARQITPEEIPVHIDEDGMGGYGVVDHARGYNFIGISVVQVAIDSQTYHRRRDELWFDTANKAKIGLIDISRLTPDMKKILQTQALAPTYRIPDGRFWVEPKDEMKKRLGYSPDDADSMNLAHTDFPDKQYDSVEVNRRPDNWRDDKTGPGHFSNR